MDRRLSSRSSSFVSIESNNKRRRFTAASESENASDEAIQKVCLYARFLQYKMLESKLDKQFAIMKRKVEDELCLGELALKNKDDQDTAIPADIKDCFLQIIETLYLFDSSQDEYQFDEFMNRLKTLLINMNTTLNKESMMDEENKGKKVLTHCRDLIQQIVEQKI